MSAATIRFAYLGLDECGSLSDATPWFTMAGVLVEGLEPTQHLIRRAATHAGKRLKRPRRAVGEFKWSNSSRRLRRDVLQRLAQCAAEVYTLTVLKGGRRIEDTPENYALLVSALLQPCWMRHPSLALAVDRHFTSPEQIAVVDTWVYRRWPAPGVLSISHVDSQRNPLVQLADFVAGSVYAGRKMGDTACGLLEPIVVAAQVEEWTALKRRWLESQ